MCSIQDIHNQVWCIRRCMEKRLYTDQERCKVIYNTGKKCLARRSMAEYTRLQDREHLVVDRMRRRR
jgi:hypothetical protein